MKKTSAIDLSQITFANGNHPAPPTVGATTQGCVMEWVSYLANEPWSDKPACVCPTIRSFLVTWNDNISDAARRTELLMPLVQVVQGTRSTDAVMLRRMWLAIDWDIRVRTVAFLRAADLTVIADAVAALPEIDCQARLNGSLATLQEAKAQAAAAWSAARDAAWSAAWSAAGAAAWSAAGAAAWSAAGAAARDAARDAAWAAARDAAGDAAWAAGKAKLAPVVAEIQASAQDLVQRMCAVTEGAA